MTSWAAKIRPHMVEREVVMVEREVVIITRTEDAFKCGVAV